MSSYDSVKRRRRYLYRVDPHCWYCGIRVFDYDYPGGGTQKPDQATLEHLVSKRNPMRRTDIGMYITARVLACYDCNYERGKWTSLLLYADKAAFRAAYEAWNPTIGELAGEVSA
jgi:hypothetical protein